MNYRAPFLCALAAIGAAGGFMAACSSDPTVTTPDPGVDSGTDTGSVTVDAGKPDSAKPPLPVCTKNGIKGECDVVSQNCPNNGECAVVPADAGPQVTKCQPKGTGSIVEGDLCTKVGNDNPCVAGLECLGSKGNARCSRHCCSDTSQCGTSPDGLIGVCTLNVVDSKTQTPLYEVCLYAKPCQPFGLQACPSGQTCLVQDAVGTAICIDIFNPPGKKDGESCTSANECQDGMMCVGTPGVCTFTCFGKGKSPPFDAGGLGPSSPAGLGGCPPNQVCGVSSIKGLPDWLKTCQ